MPRSFLSFARELAHAAARSPESHIAHRSVDPKRLVNATEAAEITGLSIETLRVYRCIGRLRAVSKRYERPQYLVRDLQAYLAKRWGRRS